MRDSDWLDPFDPTIRTIYSKSECRAEANYSFRGDVDVNISDWLRLPQSLELRPLFAFEFQRSNLMAHDGAQWATGEPTIALPGDSLHFRQDYYLYQIGLRVIYSGINVGKYINIRIRGESDWGPARGYDEDKHLLRNVFTNDRTLGYGLYCSSGLDMVVAKAVTIGFTMDYLQIRTKGTHLFRDPDNENELEWKDGVKVWSDQTSLTAHIAYAF